MIDLSVSLFILLQTLSRARKRSAEGKKQSVHSPAEDGDRVSISETKLQVQEVKGELKSVRRSGSASRSSTLKGPATVSRPVTRSFLKQIHSSTQDDEEVILPDAKSEDLLEEIDGEERSVSMFDVRALLIRVAISIIG